MTVVMFLYNLAISTFLYGFLHKKTRINKKFLFIDNIFVAAAAFLFVRFFSNSFLPAFFLSPVLVLGLALALTMIRFWRTPHRKMSAGDRQIV